MHVHAGRDVHSIQFHASPCMQDPPADYTRNCTEASNYVVRSSLVPKKLPNMKFAQYRLPNDDPPRVPSSICNIAMPGQSTRARYLWV